ncbi:uncharacterized protein LOC125817718 [Solanum verrucosum]|uniref:uncharacterized protein LOC125817718 n=1 Tax=Solanum verrucosum TaxID=315347 RepID=UPI0020D077E8|nr:uncharacterized protein LOC125817718 [Solanum verrucosum]
MARLGGVSSYGYCLRDEKGDLIRAEGFNIESTTNTVAEARAILAASRHCKQEQYHHVIIQTDSLLLCKVLEEKWTCPWIINGIVEDTKESLLGKQYRFQHIMREGNQLADYVANMAIEKGNCIFTDFHSMDA